METPRLRVAFGALPRFGVTALRLRALGSLLLALERRRIAHPTLRTTQIFKVGLQQGFEAGEIGFGRNGIAPAVGLAPNR